MSKSTVLFTLCIFLLSLIPQLWFPGNAILLGYDNVFPLAPTSFLYDRIYSWSWLIGFGSDQSAIQGSLLIHLIDSVPHFMGFSDQMSQRIVFSFWFFMLLFSAYFFVFVLEKNKLIKTSYARYFFPIFYALNFYNLQAWWIAERTKFSLLVATPLILCVLVPLLNTQLTLKKAIKNGIVCAFILTIFNGGGWLGFSLYGGLLVLIFIFYLFYSITRVRSKLYLQIVLLHLLFLTFGISFILFNAYTILPFLSATLSEYGSLIERSGGIEGITGWTRYLSENTSILNLLRLQGIPDWYDNISHPYANSYLRNPFLVFVSFLFPVLLFCSFLLKKENKRLMLFLFLSSFVTLFFTAGIHYPFGELFALLMKYVPGFLIFRSAIYKFGYSYWLVAGLLMSFSLSGFIDLLRRKVSEGKELVAPVFFILFVLIILLYNYPFFNGNFFHVDPHYASSRVELPVYARDFSEWWKQHGRGQRVLLLPQLNNDRHFEIYQWKYLSLNPVLANFGNTGIIENTVLLSPHENQLVVELYDAINESDKKNVERLTSLLGIKYVLLRFDFAYDYPGVETDNPYEVAKKIENISLKKIKEFGRWYVYELSGEKPIVRATTTAYVSDSGLLETQSSDMVQLSEIPEGIEVSDFVAHARCISCEAERAEVGVVFPKPRILLDSRLYQIIEIRDKLFKKRELSFEEQLFMYTGESLKYAAQLKELIERDKPELYIKNARDKYTEILFSYSELIDEIPQRSINPYLTAVTLQDYSHAQVVFLNDLVLQAGKKNQQAVLEVILGQLDRNDKKLMKIIDRDSFTREKVYSLSAPVAGTYVVSIKKDSLGKIGSYQGVSMELDGKSLTPIETESTMRFDDIYLEQGDNTIVLHLPPQESVLSVATREEHAGRACYLSTLDGYGFGKVYSLDFSVKNNFDPNFMFFVDDGIRYEPKLLGYFKVSGEQKKQQRYILSSDTVALSKVAKTMRVGFCSPSLDEERFKENVENLRVIELTAPDITAVRSVYIEKVDSPTIRVEEKNPTDFVVHVEKAASPFLLTVSSRFSHAWKASEGTHLQGNLFQNVWLIERKGTYDLSIHYSLQRFVTYGAFVSVSSVVSGIVILYLLRKKEK
jgi:hypothetical protein